MKLVESPAGQPVRCADACRIFILRKMAHNWVVLTASLLLAGVSHWWWTVERGLLVIETIDYRIASLGN